MTDVLVLGAGIAGLLAARRCVDAGLDVVVLDKGHRAGGRMATRRVDGAVFDHGAQFLTLQDPEVRSLARTWEAAGVLATWFHGSPDGPDSPGAADSADGHPRHRGAPTMRSLPEHLASGLDVRLVTRVVRLAAGAAGDWSATTADGTTFTARALVATPPVPQTLALLDAGGVDLPGDLAATLRGAAYAPTIALLAVPVDEGHHGPLLGPRGARRLDTPPLVWLADNATKGVSPAPALTVHADAATSADLWEHDDEAVAAALLPAVAAHVHVPLRVVHVQRWRYATPLHDLGAVTLHTATPAPLWIAGDACTGGRVEGAARSGLAAGAGVVDLLA